MIREINLRKILGALLLFFILPYIFLTESFTHFFSDLGFVIKFISYIISSILFILLSKWKWLNSLILGNDFIGGAYEGESKRITLDTDKQQIEQNKITIFQSLLSTEISGNSFDKNNNQNAEYNGVLIDGKNGSYTFFVKIKTTHNERSGIIELNFNNDNVVGFGTSIEIDGTTKWRFKLKKTT